MIETGTQIKAARALLGWRRKDLAQAAGLHVNAVAYWEGHDVIPPQLPSGRRNSEPVACQLIREALLKNGVEAINDPPGVRFVY